MSGNCLISRFPSVDALVTECRNENVPKYMYGQEGAHKWDNGVTYAEALTKAVEGDTTITAHATEAAAKLNLDSIADSPRFGWQSTVAGSRVDVPAYLAGSPNCMRRRVKRDSANRHVRLFVALSSSVGVNAQDLITRGATILVLLEYLQAIGVSVDLTLYSELHAPNFSHGNELIVIDIESRPLDLSTASFAIGHPAFGRHVCYAYGAYVGGASVHWPHAYYRSDYDAIKKEWLGFQPGDIDIRSAHLDTTLYTTPQTWLENTIRQIQETP